MRFQYVHVKLLKLPGCHISCLPDQTWQAEQDNPIQPFPQLYPWPFLQATDMLEASVRKLLHTPWTRWSAFLTCDLLPHEVDACQHIATLSLPELAAIRQVSPRGAKLQPRIAHQSWHTYCANVSK